MRSYYDLSKCSSIAWSRSRGTAMASTGPVSEKCINDQFRLCFVWTEAGPEEVEIVDYH
jgi:hypothetical protein